MYSKWIQQPISFLLSAFNHQILRGASSQVHPSADTVMLDKHSISQIAKCISQRNPTTLCPLRVFEMAALAALFSNSFTNTSVSYCSVLLGNEEAHVLLATHC